MPDAPLQHPILLTGATSHTGRRLARRLLDGGYPLRCLLHNPGHRSLLPESPLLETVPGSAENPDDLARAAEGIDQVVHLAHIRFAPQLLEALDRRSTPVRLIVTSSTRLLSTYRSEIREQVRIGEEEIHNAPPHVRWTILRPAMIFGGPDDNNIERLARFLRKTPVFPLFGQGRNLVQPLFVWDLVEAIVRCLERPETAAHSYILAGPRPMTYREMVAAICRAQGIRTPLFVCMPRRPAVGALKFLRRLWPGCPLDPEAVRRFGEDRSFDTFPARRDLDFQPVPFEEAMRRKCAGEV